MSTAGYRRASEERYVGWEISVASISGFFTSLNKPDRVEVPVPFCCDAVHVHAALQRISWCCQVDQAVTKLPDS